jgi:inosine-uridine nucleoside N-ribohydrolase
MTDPIRMIIDCDPGHDDALALLLASHLADVVGVTTVSGNAPLEAVTKNALSLAVLMAGDVPVHAGSAGPLGHGRPRHAIHVHGESGLDGVSLPVAEAEAGTDAVQYLLDVTGRERGLWLVAIGPLTNVARAIRADADFVHRLAGISVMGGSTRGGNVTAAAEFNIWADPEAADVVFRSATNIRLCGLNLTHQLKTSEAMVAKLKGLPGARARLAAEALSHLHARMLALTGERAAALHDPCAVLAVTHPELFEFVQRPVAVSLVDPLTRGMTVIDERFSGREGPNQIAVGYEIEAPAAFELLFEALASDRG